ncbi:MAG: hypothetical protein ACFNTB_01710 [Prevotella denticola]
MTYIKQTGVLQQKQGAGLPIPVDFRNFAARFHSSSNNRRTKGVPHRRRKDNIMLTFGIVTIVAAVLAEALIVSKKINLGE